MNFTDSSHLAQSFKKEYEMTVKQFKNKGELNYA
jgi:AraC-like DNA-binding protein